MIGWEIDNAPADRAMRDRAAAQLARLGVRLPRFAELADPVGTIAAGSLAPAAIDPERPDPANLYRMHWHNDRSRRGLAAVPVHILFPPALTGVPAAIAMVLGCFFPLIGAHKVLAAYGCLVPRLVGGGFDPARHRAIWPSTGNYCRGGVAISRILGCRAVAVLPEGMSAERFAWLQQWVREPGDVVRTPGSESNVKEIYDKCAELARDPDTVVLARLFGAFDVDFLDVAFAARRAHDVARLSDPLLQPREALGAHAFGQHGDGAATENARDRHTAAAIIAGRWPYGAVARGIEAAADQPRHKAAISRQHLVRADQRKKAAEHHRDRRRHAGQRRREQDMDRDRREP